MLWPWELDEELGELELEEGELDEDELDEEEELEDDEDDEGVDGGVEDGVGGAGIDGVGWVVWQVAPTPPIRTAPSRASCRRRSHCGIALILLRTGPRVGGHAGGGVLAASDDLP